MCNEMLYLEIFFFFYFFVRQTSFFFCDEKITIANCKLTNAIKVCGSYSMKEGQKKIVKTSDKKIVCKHTNLKHTVA